MKYYKILPKDLNTLGYQYKEGLNIDTNEINDWECSNGLHFATAKNIFKFLDYGNKIADVTIPEDAKVYHYEDKSKADKIILSNIRDLYSLDAIKELIEEGADIHADGDYILRTACIDGNLNIIKYLVDNGVNAKDNLAIEYATMRGHLDIIKYLVEHGADIHGRNDLTLCKACMYNHLDVVKYLVEHGVNIHINNDSALIWAAQFNNLDIVKYLVEHGANIHARNDLALCRACIYNHLDVVKYLVEHGATIDNDLVKVACDIDNLDIVDYLKSVINKKNE